MGAVVPCHPEVGLNLNDNDEKEAEKGSATGTIKMKVGGRRQSQGCSYTRPQLQMVRYHGVFFFFH